MVHEMPNKLQFNGGYITCIDMTASECTVTCITGTKSVAEVECDHPFV